MRVLMFALIWNIVKHLINLIYIDVHVHVFVIGQKAMLLDLYL